MGVFDSLVIQDAGGATVATIARSDGVPLEGGPFVDALGNPGPPADELVPLFVGGFGIDSRGNAYYDTGVVPDNEAASVYLHPSVNRIILLSGSDR